MKESNDKKKANRTKIRKKTFEVITPGGNKVEFHSIIGDLKRPAPADPEDKESDEPS